MRRQALLLVLVMAAALAAWLPAPAAAAGRKPVEVVFMTTPFGTHMYSVGAAAEQVFKKAGSWVHIKHQETPGAMYMYRYMVKNREKMIKGEVDHTIVIGSTALVQYLAQGRPPFKRFPWPTCRALVSSPAVMGLYVTFDPGIKSLKDLAGKRVGTGERSRPFQGILLDKPLFSVLGIFKQIKWAPLGAVGSKDAFLNGRLDAVPLRMMGLLMVAKKGLLVTPRCAGGPASMEILNSGKKLYFIPYSLQTLQKVNSLPGVVTQYPVLFKKGAFKGLDRDVLGRAGPGAVLCDAGLPDAVAAEITRVWSTHRQDFARYHAVLNFLPRTPYPLGARPQEVHPGTLQAMKRMGLPVPQVKF